MVAGAASGTAVAALALLAGVLVHPANWVGCGWCPGGLVGTIWPTSTTSSSVTTVTPLACPPPGPSECPAAEPESFHVLGEGVTGSTVEVPSWLLLAAGVAAEGALAVGAWRCCARKASEARRRQPLGEARLQIK